MKTVTFAGLAMTAGLGLATTAAAQDDDWEFQHDPAQNIAIAAARYDAGQMIVVQCRDGKLTAVVTGLPASAEPLRLNAARADGRSDQQTWTAAGAAGAYRSNAPGRDVRFMKGGGLYSVQTADGAEPSFRGAFDLPTQSANLDRVLTTCGWSTTDERDALGIAPGVSLTDPGARRPARRQRSALSRAPRREVEPPVGAPVTPPAEQLVSCVVRDMHLKECRAEHQASAARPDIVRALRFYEDREVYATEGSDAAANEGKVVFLNGPQIVVTVDYIGRAD